MQRHSDNGGSNQKNQIDFSNESVCLLLESITDGFYYVDRSWTVKYFNKQAERILNVTRDEIIGRSLWECYPEEYGKAFYGRFNESLRTQKPLYFEEFLKRLSLWAELAVYPSNEGLSVHFSDITDRKEKEQQLREMNHNYRMITRATSGAIWEYLPAKNLCFWHDEHFKELFGHDIVNAHVPHSFWKDLIHPDDRQNKLAQVADQLKNGREMDRSEYRFKKADGSYAYVLERTFLQKDEHGTPVKLIGCTEDITAFKLAEQELRKSEINHRLLFQKTSLAEIICTQDTLEILKVNDAAGHMYGYTNEEFLNLNIHDLRPVHEKPFLMARVRQARNSKTETKYMASHVKKNGEQMIVEVSAVGMDYDGVACFLITLTDHTHRTHLEKQIQDLRITNQKNVTKATLDGQEKQREEIAKELHDNVNQVLATSKLLLSCLSGLSKKQANLVEKCKESIAYCIDEIRRLSRSFTPPSLGEISLDEAIHSLVGSIPFMKEETVDIDITGLDENEMEEGFKVSIYRIIQEQLNNILKYAEASRIFIRLSNNNYNLILLIEDNGKGFDVNAKRKGIGLNNIKNRAELYNGELIIESAPNAGCRLIVTFDL